MKISIQSIVDVVVAIYNAFFKGRTVKIGGQDVVLPNEGQVPPLRGSKFDSKPHKFDAPDVPGRR